MVVVVAIVVDLIEVELIDRFFRRRGLDLQVDSFGEAVPLPASQLQFERALGEGALGGFAVGGGSHLAAFHLLRYVIFAAGALELLRLVLRLTLQQRNRSSVVGGVVRGLPCTLDLHLLSFLTVGLFEINLHEFDGRMRQVVLIIAISIVHPALIV